MRCFIRFWKRIMHTYKDFSMKERFWLPDSKAGGRGGIILLRLDDEESVDNFCAEDPFAKSNIQTYRVVEFELYQIQEYANSWR